MKVCSLGVWDESVPGISFDTDGVSNYARIQQKLMTLYPRGTKGREDWAEIVKEAKKCGRNKRYDCIVGVSGGVDSSYLLYLIKEKYGLRPLAVTLDNGWSSETAVRNIKLITDAIGVDLETHVIEYEEIKDLIRSFMFAGLPWIDVPTDTAIKGVMYKLALKFGIKYIFRGNDFRTEGKQPREWTYCDDRQLRYIHRKFGKKRRLKTFPHLSFLKIVYSGFVRGIKDVRPYYYLDYSKSEARDFLEKSYGWKYYGGHHHENIFTKFVMAYWLPEKFKIDKRIVNLSAQVVSGYMSREKALSELSEPPLEQAQKVELERFVLKKLDLTGEEFKEIMITKNKSFRDYPNNEGFLFMIMKYLSPFIKLVYPQKPMTFVAMEVDQKVKKPGVIIIEGHVQGLSNTRALGALGIPVYVVDKSNCIARYSRHCRKFIYSPDYISPDFAGFLIQLARDEGLDGWTLIPSNDHALYSISKHKSELGKYFKILAPDEQGLQRIYDKTSLLSLAMTVGIPIPQTFYFRSPGEIDTSLLPYPLLTKGRHGLSFYRELGKKALLSNDPAELAHNLELIEEHHGIANSFTQELIPSDETNKTISFTAFCVDGVIKTHWSGVKMREHPLRFGTATFAASIENPVCYQQSVTLLEALKYTGVCEVEYLLDPRTGQYKLIEINARTWLWVGLAKACGIDYAKIIYNHANGIENDFPAGYASGIKWINYITDTYFSFKALISGKLKPGDYFSSLRGRKINAVFSWRDLLPGLMFLMLAFYIARKRR